MRKRKLSFHQDDEKIKKLQTRKAEMIRSFIGIPVQISYNGDYRGEMKCTLSKIYSLDGFGWICEIDPKTVEIIEGPKEIRVMFVKNITNIKEV
ncbi:MAG: hypothetical protein WC697_03365 [Patescibacteria group bacterium]|jgi:hypothetical protein